MNGVSAARAAGLSPALLPEPAPNRAQTLPGSILMRWLRGVIERDRDGYVVIAGSGRTQNYVTGVHHSDGEWLSVLNVDRLIEDADRMAAAAAAGPATALSIERVG